jgi:hypothetical protein
MHIVFKKKRFLLLNTVVSNEVTCTEAAAQLIYLYFFIKQIDKKIISKYFKKSKKIFIHIYFYFVQLLLFLFLRNRKVHSNFNLSREVTSLIHSSIFVIF